METLVFDPPNHDEFKSKSPEPKKSTKIPVKRQDSLPKLTKNPSMASIKVKKRPNPNPKYAKANEATFHEITRLTSLNDEQKAQIAKLVQEIKTLKIVNARQEKGLLMMDKEQGDYPKLFKSMTEELRIHKIEKHKAQERVAILERMSITQSEEFHKLQTRYKELKLKLKQIEQGDIGLLRQENVKMEVELQKKELLVQVLISYKELNDKLKVISAERDREIHFTKTKTAKIMKELDLAKTEHIRLSNLLHVSLNNKERERVVNSLSIYSRNSMHDSGDESSHTSSHHGLKKKKPVVVKQLSKITDVDESEVKPTTPVVTVSLTEAPQQTVYKPVLKTQQKLNSPSPQPKSKRSTPYPCPSPEKSVYSDHVSFNPTIPASVYSDDFE